MTEFRSRYNLFVTSVQVNGKRVHVEFTGMRDGGSYYIGTDPEVVKALKKQMTNYYYVFREVGPVIVEDPKTGEKVELPLVDGGALTEKDLKPEPDKGADPSEVESVTNISEAKEYLRTLGVDHRKMNTPKSILKQADEAGVVFPNLTQ